MTPELLRELDGVAQVFHDTPHGDFLRKVADAVRNSPPASSDKVLAAEDVERLRKYADVPGSAPLTGAEVVELCDSHEALRRLWRNTVLAIVNHEHSITEGVRDPVEIDVELWSHT